MIKEILDEYQKKRTASSKEFEQLKVDNKKIARHMTEVYIDNVNKDVRKIHSNQKRIIEEIRKLKTGSEELVKQAQSWIELYDGLSGSLKEAGDIINWYNVLEKRASFVKDKLEERLNQIDQVMSNKTKEEVNVEETEKEVKDEEIVVLIETRKDNAGREEDKSKVNNDEVLNENDNPINNNEGLDMELKEINNGNVTNQSNNEDNPTEVVDTKPKD